MPKTTLKGKRIVITRSVRAGKVWAHYLEKRGVTVYQFPVIEGLLIAPTKKLAHTLGHLEDFSWIVFTSFAGPYCMRDLMKKMKIPLDPKKMPPVAVIGKKTGDAVREIGCRVSLTSSRPDSSVLARDLKPGKVRPVLLLRADIASDELPEALKARGARVIDVPVYRTKIIKTPAGEEFYKLLMEKKIDGITFASPSAVDGFRARVKEKGMKMARGIPAIALGKSVALALQWAGFRDIRVAAMPTIRDLTDAILLR